MDDGFWLFIILQLAALGPFADSINMAGVKKYVLVGGVVASLGAACCTLLLGYGGVSADATRNALKLAALVALMVSLGATATSVALPMEFARRRA